jgi:hypothetical protein
MFKFQVIRSIREKFVWTREIDPEGEIVPNSDVYEVYDLIADPREMHARAPTAAEVATFQAAVAGCIRGDCPPLLS